MPLVDLLNVVMGRMKRACHAPTPDLLHLGCSYHLHSSHCFLSTWGAIMLKKKKKTKKKNSLCFRLTWSVYELL